MKSFATVFMPTFLLVGAMGTTAISTLPQVEAQDSPVPLLPTQEQGTSTKQLTFDANGDEYKRWLHQDVRWIITPEERQAFLVLSNDQERDAFIRQFWVRRNPSPRSAKDRFKEEHYRRMAFANTHFAAGEPGWKTDRGHVYIAFGPPDSISSHPAAGNSVTKSFQVWHYRSIQVGWPPNLESDVNRHIVQPTIIKDFDFKFVDEFASGQYRLDSLWPSTNDPAP
jgi:GWxTD domain-containing protein